uniref:Uncharacterized protein n=1 Tax=Aegilops tauschii TaxID=37682 RepID=M8BWT7_AEGTA
MPNVVGAEGRFVLLRAASAERSGLSEYFLYKAAGDADEPPSLQWIPSPYEHNDGDDLRGVKEFGILPLGDHYLVAPLCLASSSDLDYHLRIYWPERKSWSTRTLRDPCPGVGRIVPGKVITLGEEGLLGWVDLSLDLLIQTNKMSHSASPGKLKKEPESTRSPAPASWFRDLAWVDGMLKFTEIENWAPEKWSDKDIIYDSDLIMSLERKAADMNSKQLSFRDAWRAVIWTRTVPSNCWRQACAADVADILVDGSLHSSLFSGPKGETVRQVTTFGGLYLALPILNLDGDDIIYLKSLAEPNNRDGWVAAVDIGTRRIMPAYFFVCFQHICRFPKKIGVALRSQRVTRSERLVGLQTIQATPRSVWASSIPANQGAKSKAKFLIFSMETVFY